MQQGDDAVLEKVWLAEVPLCFIILSFSANQPTVIRNVMQNVFRSGDGGYTHATATVMASSSFDLL